MATLETMEKIVISESIIENTPMEELASYHLEIEEKYKGVNFNDITINPDLSALMAFNGYYTMTHAKGAIFTVDTIMHIQG